MTNDTTRPRNWRVGAGIALALAGTSLAYTALPAAADSNPNITICHAAPPDQAKKFVVITIDGDAIFKVGHDTHSDDVIPPFAYTNQQGKAVSYDGKNWQDNWAVSPEGVAQEEVTAADCVAGQPPTTTTKTTTTSTTSTTPASSSSSSSSPAPVVTQPGGGKSNKLAFTGSDTTPALLTGLLMILAGAGLIAARRLKFVKS